MHELLEHLVGFDRTIAAAAADLRWAPLTALFVLASAWWVKGPLYVAAGAVRDVRRRALPVTALAVAASVVLADLVSGGLKQVVDRARPPAADPPAVDAAVSLPSSPSFPSGHATTAFAAAVAVAVLVPRLRWPALALATLVAISRVYLGVHFALDVVAGAALGTLIGLAVALVARRYARSRAAVRAEAGAPATS